VKTDTSECHDFIGPIEKPALLDDPVPGIDLGLNLDLDISPGPKPSSLTRNPDHLNGTYSLGQQLARLKPKKHRQREDSNSQQQQHNLQIIENLKRTPPKIITLNNGFEIFFNKMLISLVQGKNSKNVSNWIQKYDCRINLIAEPDIRFLRSDSGYGPGTNDGMDYDAHFDEFLSGPIGYDHDKFHQQKYQQKLQQEEDAKQYASFLIIGEEKNAKIISKIIKNMCNQALSNRLTLLREGERGPELPMHLQQPPLIIPNFSEVQKKMPENEEENLRLINKVEVNEIGTMQEESNNSNSSLNKHYKIITKETSSINKQEPDLQIEATAAASMTKKQEIFDIIIESDNSSDTDNSSVIDKKKSKTKTTTVTKKKNSKNPSLK